MRTCEYFAETARYLVAYHRLYEAVVAVASTAGEEDGTREDLRGGLLLIEAEMQRAVDFTADFILSPEAAINARLGKLIDALEFDVGYKFGPGAVPALFTPLAHDAKTRIVAYKDDQVVFEIAAVTKGKKDLFGALEAWQFSDYALEIELLFDTLELDLTEELREAMDFAKHALAIPHPAPDPLALSEIDPPGLIPTGSDCPNTVACFDQALHQLQDFTESQGWKAEVVFGVSGKDGAGQVRTYKNFSWCGNQYDNLHFLFRFDNCEDFIVRVAKELCTGNPFGLMFEREI